MSELLKGAYDLHVHTGPDVVARKCSDLELADRMRAAGMAGGVLKSHYLDTAGRAGLLNELYPDLNIVGGIVLNRSVGGNNPWAVERSAQAGGRMLWFATLEARAYPEYHQRNNPVKQDLSSYITVVDEKGRLLPEVLDVLDVAAKYHLVTGTGHVSAEEGMLLVREGQRRGVQMVVTHSELPSNLYSNEQLAEAVRLGAVVEHSYITPYTDRVTWDALAEMIRTTGCENVFLSTDLGQPKNPYFDEGLEAFAIELMKQGFSEDDINMMIKTVPARLIAGN